MPVGPRAVLAEVASNDEVMRLHALVRGAGHPSGRPEGSGPISQVASIVPAARTVLFDGVPDVPALIAAVEALVERPAPDAAPAGDREVEVPVHYDGADLAEVARRWGMTTQEAARTHAGATYVVAFCGFAPGFAYCTGLPADLHLPRLATPRVRVPAGSVGIAGEFTGVYPSSSPGGWLLLGATDLRLWDEGADEPATLAPGTRVRFVEVDR